MARPAHPPLTEAARCAAVAAARACYTEFPGSFSAYGQETMYDLKHPLDAIFDDGRSARACGQTLASRAVAHHGEHASRSEMSAIQRDARDGRLCRR